MAGNLTNHFRMVDFIEYDVQGILLVPPLRIITGPYIDYSGMSIGTGFAGQNMSFSSFDSAELSIAFDQVDLLSNI